MKLPLKPGSERGSVEPSCHCLLWAFRCFQVVDLNLRVRGSGFGVQGVVGVQHLEFGAKFALEVRAPAEPSTASLVNY